MESEYPQIIIPHRINRTFIQNHREWNFIYSFDVFGKSALGQSAFAHCEPNTFPVFVMWKFCANPVYFQDGGDGIENIKQSINSIPRDKPIIPFPHIGLGHSRMKEFAPKMWNYLMLQLDAIKYPNIQINYYGH